MRHFATLALAALLLAPAALAQTVGISPDPFPSISSATTAYKSSSLVAITQNSSLDIENGTVACRSAGEDEDGEEVLLGTTNNSFYRVFDLAKFTLPDNPELTSVDFGVRVSYFEESTRTATGALIISTLPAGTDVSTGFFRNNLSELASADLVFESDTLALINTGFDDPDNPFDGAPALNGDELLVVELEFDDGSQTDEDPRAYDARAAGNQADADGDSYISTNPDCGGQIAEPSAFNSIGDFPTQFVVVLNISTVGDGGGVVTIGEGRSAGVGETVTVAGTVTRAAGDFVYIQDETGGLTIRQTSGDFFDQVADGTIEPGTTVEVTGVLSEFNGLLQINGDDLTSFTVTGEGDIPDPQTVTLAEIAANGEDFEGELVTVNGVTLTTMDTEFMARTTYDITDASDGSGAVTLRVPNADDGTADGSGIPASTLNITGIVGQFDSDDPRDEGYQILLVSADDVEATSTAIGEDPEGRLSLGAVVPNPSAAQAAVMVTLQEASHATVAVYDVLGRQVSVVLDRAVSAGTSSVDLEVGDLPAGTYVVRLSANGTTVVRPFTVAR